MSLVVLSIVSHNQMELVNKLLADVKKAYLTKYKIIVRSNIDENVMIDCHGLEVMHVKNESPKGFGCNHNMNFNLIMGDYFVILNPDIRFDDVDIFNKLIKYSSENDDRVIISPTIQNSNGKLEDNGRYFPTPFKIIRKILFRDKTVVPLRAGSASTKVDWVGGMFMFTHSRNYQILGGFDERYFLYYEDVDLCYRAANSSINREIFHNASVIHEARRSSHRDIRYLKWHISSLIRFWIKYFGRKE